MPLHSFRVNQNERPQTAIETWTWTNSNRILHRKSVKISSPRIIKRISPKRWKKSSFSRSCTPFYCWPVVPDRCKRKPISQPRTWRKIRWPRNTSGTLKDAEGERRLWFWTICLLSDLRAKLEMAIDKVLNAVRVASTFSRHNHGYTDDDNSSSVTTSDAEDQEQVRTTHV